MNNAYLANLSKIEFVVTDACTGSCKHCAAGNHTNIGARIHSAIAADAVRSVAEHYPIQTVMAFGGEPLLHLEAVEAILRAAREVGVPHRQLITNGFFTEEKQRMRETARVLAEAGVNDLLLSVDAFHQETIPVETVHAFAREVMAVGIPMRLCPAWLVSREDENAYNEQTRRILAAFADIGIPEGKGNVIFPEGNARLYLAEYFSDGAPENPYLEDPYDVRCLSFSASGDVLGDNVYRRDILQILEQYDPQNG